MRNIQDLPNEVLRNVFRLGCDSLEFIPLSVYDDTKPSHARRRKKFIENVRLVCFRWQRNVDLPNLPYGRRFWFARLSLSLREDPSHQTRYTAAPNIVRERLIRIREIMSTSQGCDLIVVLDGRASEKKPPPFGYLPRILDSYDDASPAQQLSIKLFLHGAFEILQQHNQILTISVVAHANSMHKSVVELLASWVLAPRLCYIIIGFSPGRGFGQAGSTGSSLQSVASSISIPGFDTTYPLVPSLQERFKLSLMKFAHIHSLSIPSLWLQDLSHHITVDELSLGMWQYSEVVQFVTTFLHIPLCTGLQALKLDMFNVPLGLEEGPELGIGHREILPYPFTQLKYLKIDWVDDVNVYRLLLCMECPQLTSAYLLPYCYPQFLTRSRWAPTDQNRFPLLNRLELDFISISTLDSLYLLDTFKYSPVEQLFLSHIHFPKGNTTEGSHQMLMSTLSHFKPDEIRVSDSTVECILVILGGLNCYSLHKLNLQINQDDSPSYPSADGLSPFGSQWVPQVIDLPFLSILKVDGTASCLPHLFQWINAEGLEDLDLSIYSRNQLPNLVDDDSLSNDTAMGMQASKYPLPYYLSLHTMEITIWVEEQLGKIHHLDETFLPHIWEMSPNLTHLTLTAWQHLTVTRPTLSDQCNLIFSSLNPIHTLPLKEDGFLLLPLPLLSHLEVTYQENILDDPDLIAHEVEVARNTVVSHLVSRHGKGACYLELREFGYHKKVLKFCAKANEEQVH